MKLNVNYIVIVTKNIIQSECLHKIETERATLLNEERLKKELFEWILIDVLNVD